MRMFSKEKDDIRSELKVLKAKEGKKEKGSPSIPESPSSETNNNDEFSSSWDNCANDCIHFKLVRTAADISDESKTFHPLYSHQLFDEEKILGYKKLKINMFFSATALNCYLDIFFEEHNRAISTDIKGILMRKIFQPQQWQLISNLDDFLKLAENEVQTFSPPGELVYSYDVPDPQENKVQQYQEVSTRYEIYKGKPCDTAISSFHKRMEPFILFFIDGSSFIDRDDLAWELYFVFQKQIRNSIEDYRFIGFSSVYDFYCYPDKIRRRISQLLILPPYQKSGHGSHLLNAIYNCSKTSDVRDITVEEPNLDFSRMRDSVDIVNILKIGKFRERPLKPLDSSIIEEIREKLKLRKEQVEHCYDILLLSTVNRHNEEEYKRYRLAIKRKLFKKFQDILSAFEGAEQKAELDKLYRDHEKDFLAVLKRVENLISF